MNTVAIEILINDLVRLAHKEHFHCEEDTWYDCPKSGQCCNENALKRDKCDCGAERHNKKVDDILKELSVLLKQE